MHLRAKPAEISAGLIQIALGAAVVAIASQYAVGTIARMGPGFVPIALGVGLIAFGLINTVIAVQTAPENENIEIPVGSLAIATAGLVVFAVLAPRAGLVPATVMLVIIASFADRPIRPWIVLGLVATVPLFGYLVFVRGLMIPLRPFWW